MIQSLQTIRGSRILILISFPDARPRPDPERVSRSGSPLPPDAGPTPPRQGPGELEAPVHGGVRRAHRGLVARQLQEPDQVQHAVGGGNQLLDLHAGGGQDVGAHLLQHHAVPSHGEREEMKT